MDAHKFRQRVERGATVVLVALLAFGLWQAYGAWALGAEISHGK